MSSPTPEFVDEIVRAGAGAGKTWRLTEKTLEIAQAFLSTSNRLPKLVITTFTKKATEELRERITKRALAADDPRVLELVRSRQYLQISTIHGVLSTFLRSYGHLAGLESEFTVVDESVSRFQAKRILRDIIKSTSLGSEMLRAFTFEDVLSACLQYRRMKMAHPKANGFTLVDYDHSVRQMYEPLIQNLRATIAQILSEGTDAKWQDYLLLVQGQISGIENLSEKIKSVGRKPSFPRAEGKTLPFRAELEEGLSDSLKAIEKLDQRSFMDRQHWKSLAQNTASFGSLGDSFIEAINKFKAEGGSFDSEDLELFTLEVLRREPSLGDAFASEWDYWLVDEYQDTSPTQVEILNRLIGKTPCFFVGDPQQSIYLFRGARKEVFEQRERSVLESGGAVNEMLMNRRSRPEVLVAINDRIVELGEGFATMQPRSEEFDPSHQAIHVFQSAEKGESPYFALANFVARKLEAGQRADDFCVLSRTNKILNAVAMQFEELGIPCAVHAATGFFSRREILDLMSLFKFLWNPFDQLNLLRLLRSPWYLVDDQQLADWSKQNENHLWLYLKDHGAEHPTIKRLITALDQVSTKGLSEAFMLALVDSRIVDFSHRHDPTGRRESNIWKLVAWLKQAERSAGFKPSHVHRTFEKALRGEDDESDAAASKEPNRVNLMTVHKAKGLSFKNVILPNMEKAPRFSSVRAHEQLLIFNESAGKYSMAGIVDGKILHSPSAHHSLKQLEEREREETKRLLYVAMTRAEDSMIFHSQPNFQRGFSKDSWAGQIQVWHPERFKNKDLPYRVQFHDEIEASEQMSRIEFDQPLKVKDKFVALSEKENRNRFSVSSLLVGETPFVAAPVEEKDNVDATEKLIRAPSFGTLLHEALELLRYSTPESILKRYKEFAGADYPKFAKAINYVMQLGNPPVTDLLKTGHVEWGFQLKTKRGVLEGQIDLWGQVGDTAWILDYKSGQTRYVGKAFDQLEIYAFAIARSMNIKKVKLAVLFPLSEACEIRDVVDIENIGRKYDLV